MPADARLDPDAAPFARVVDLGGGVLASEIETEVECEGQWAVVRELPTAEEGRGQIELRIRYTTCADLDFVPHAQHLRRVIDVELGADAPDVADV